MNKLIYHSIKHLKKYLNLAAWIFKTQKAVSLKNKKIVQNYLVSEIVKP